MDWTAEIIAQLRGLWDEGHSTAEIGRRLGLSKNAVIGKAHRLNLPPRASPIRRREEGEVAAAAVPPQARPAPAEAAAVRHRAPPPPATAQAARPAAPAAARPRPDRDAAPPVVAPFPRAAPPPPSPAVVRPFPRPAAAPRACCWPMGDPGTAGFRFCGAEAAPAKPYCAEHAAIAYVKVRDRREDAA